MILFSVWRLDFIPVCNRACCDPCGKGTAFHHGLFVRDLGIYGLFHRSLPRNRKEYRTHSDRHSWFLRIPCDLGIYDLCPFPHADIPVSALCIFVDHYRSGRGSILLEELQKDSYFIMFILHIPASEKSPSHIHPAHWVFPDRMADPSVLGAAPRG